MMGRISAMSTLVLALGFATAAIAEPTRITVRVLSKDAKFIGTSMGGARVTVRDADTGELLAEGRTVGGTGDTARIMKQDWKRHAPLATEDSAAFTAVIDIDEPRRIEVTAWGPRAQPQSENRVSATQWVVPGRHIDAGDGWLLVMPGFVVDVLDPPAHLKLSGVPRTVTLRANLTMM